MSLDAFTSLTLSSLKPFSVPIEVGYEFTQYATTEEQGLITLCTVVMSSANGAPRPFVISFRTLDQVAGSLAMCNNIELDLFVVTYLIQWMALTTLE